MAKTPDNASILFKKGKNIDGMTAGWSNKPFPQWWVLNPLGRAGRFGLWGFELRANFALNAPRLKQTCRRTIRTRIYFGLYPKGFRRTTTADGGSSRGLQFIFPCRRNGQFGCPLSAPFDEEADNRGPERTAEPMDHDREWRIVGKEKAERENEQRRHERSDSEEENRRPGRSRQSGNRQENIQTQQKNENDRDEASQRNERLVPRG